jgi:hypothetical protein
LDYIKKIENIIKSTIIKLDIELIQNNYFYPI